MLQRLPNARLTLLGASLFYLINSSLHWQQLERYSFRPSLTFMGFAQTEWHGVGVLAVILALAVLVCEAARMLVPGFEVGSEAADNLAVTLLTVVVAASTVLAFRAQSLDRNWPAWLGLGLSVVMVGVSALRTAELPRRETLRRFTIGPGRHISTL